MTRPAGMRRLTGSDRRARPPAATPDALLLTRARGPARQPLVSIPPQRSAMPWRVRGLGWAASCRRHRMVACGNRQRGSRCPAAGGGPGWRFPPHWQRSAVQRCVPGLGGVVRVPDAGHRESPAGIAPPGGRRRTRLIRGQPVCRAAGTKGQMGRRLA